jgi:hypothetical protein
MFMASLCGAGAQEAALTQPPGSTSITRSNIFESSIAPAVASQLDRLVFAHLARQGIQPVLCSDAVFVRRAYVDVLGTVPTAKEARDFIQDSDVKNKRVLLIDRLLARDEFADYWAMKWSDVLRIKAEFPVNLWPNAAQAYHRWVRASIAENKPYDKFARELLTASGSNFRVGPANFYRAVQNRAPESIASAVALTFMGARFESWPADRRTGMAAFFSQLGYKPTGEWKEEHVFWDPFRASAAPGNIAPGRAAIADIGRSATFPSQPTARPATNPVPTRAVFPDGTPVQLAPDRDPRETFADWLLTPQNPWFTRSIVNRVWAWLLGRGIIHEPDDIRDDNPPVEPALLACLEKEMVACRYDLKRFYRVILTSETYQLSSRPGQPGSDTNALGYAVRRLDAEVLSDAVNKIAGTADLYTSPIPEPFTYIPQGIPAVAIADGSITSPFLTLFGRSARATGTASERNNKPTSAQWLYLINSSDVQKKVEQGPNLQAIYSSGRKPEAIIEELYLTILSRFPTVDEVNMIQAYAPPQPAREKPARKPGATNTLATVGEATNAPGPQAASTNPAIVSAAAPIPAVTNAATTGRRGPIGSLGKRTSTPDKTVAVRPREDWVDVAWALINNEEFLYRH